MKPPFLVALARSAARIPDEGSLRGGVIYEPKWDGVRLVAGIAERVTLWSRQGKDLTQGFPDLVEAAREQLPAGCVVDGEAVAWSGGRLDFERVLRRVSVGAGCGNGARSSSSSPRTGSH